MATANGKDHGPADTTLRNLVDSVSKHPNDELKIELASVLKKIAQERVTGEHAVNLTLVAKLCASTNPPMHVRALDKQPEFKKEPNLGPATKNTTEAATKQANGSGAGNTQQQQSLPPLFIDYRLAQDIASLRNDVATLQHTSKTLMDGDYFLHQRVKKLEDCSKADQTGDDYLMSIREQIDALECDYTNELNRQLYNRRITSGYRVAPLGAHGSLNQPSAYGPPVVRGTDAMFPSQSQKQACVQERYADGKPKGCGEP